MLREYIYKTKDISDYLLKVRIPENAICIKVVNGINDSRYVEWLEPST